MSGMFRTLIAAGCLSLTGCLTTMWSSPYGHVVSEWAGDNTSFEPPPVTDLNKIPDPSADNSSAEVPQASEPPRLDSPFDRARAKQLALEPVPMVPPSAVTPIEHRNPAPTPALMPTAPSPALLNDPPSAAQPQPIPSTKGGAIVDLPLAPVGQPVPIGAGRTTPTVRGGILDLGPNDSGVERALELAHQLSLLEGENKLLSMRIRQLEGDLEIREKLIDTAKTEVDSASKDVVRARDEIESLRKDLAAARERLRQAAQDDLETLQTILTVLRRITPTAAPMRPSIRE